MNFRVEFALWFKLSREIGVGSGDSKTKLLMIFLYFELLFRGPKRNERNFSDSKLRLTGFHFSGLFTEKFERIHK